MQNKKELHFTNITERFKQKDSIVIKQLYQSNYYKMKRFILKNNGTETDAKDVFQEAFIIVWEVVVKEKFKPNSIKELEAYLFQVGKFKWLDNLKQNSKRMLLNSDFSLLDSDSLAYFNQFEKETDKQLKLLEQCLINFKDPCKSLLRKFYFEKLDYKNIAKELNYTPQTLKTLKYRCVKKLKNMMLTYKNGK